MTSAIRSRHLSPLGHGLAPVWLAISATALLASPARAEPSSPNAITAPANATVAASATTDPEVASLKPIVVTSTQIERPVFDIPASVDLLQGELMRRNQMQVNLSESLAAIPGILVQNRENYAQDLRISLRGFGSRSTFGVRGIRLYVDGIPATMPDGQGQTSNIDIASIDRIEVLRGPFSALYGNSSGGVIQIFTQEGEGPPSIGSSLATGSNGQVRYGLQASGSRGAGLGDLDYLISTSRYVTEGYRDHSGARKNLANIKLGLAPDDDSKLTLILNSVDVKADDPQGLTRDEFMEDPRQAAPNAVTYNTRKTVSQTQGGLTYERTLNVDNTLRLMAYYGQRTTRQYLAIPPASQQAPSHAGGVIDLQRDYGGFDARWESKLSLAGQPLTLIGGIAYDTVTEDRRGYNNYAGPATNPVLGVKGDLRRKETNTIWNLDPYLQASWQFAPQWTLDAGLRYSSVHFDADDHYITAGNPDDSGAATYRKALPMAALGYQPNDNVHLYATIGRGFETPAFSELSYRNDNLPGLNLDLQPSVNTSVEIGAKIKLGRGLLTAALFQTRTDDEIVTASSLGGRTTYRNAGRTRRDGFELGWSGELARHLRGTLAYTWLNARYRDGFNTPDGVIPSGNQIPGVARQSAFASLDWAPPSGWQAGVEGRYLGKMYVNDSNDEATPSYFTAALHAGYVWSLENWRLNAFARVDNVLDKRYAGSAIINAGFGRYYEPAPGRNWTAGLNASFQF
ncbi:TonB-dependent receptor [Allopusillimonas ginsengisoli]|uniref:TonB-dependent receptor n=1 Tax=Allopusillimonas ginsengisoli TaxID=453575 RepID=UPI00101FE8F7|nr:TonB-dependent receptor [Allopusillimonas ginsengisoli]TEA77069.1 TonB-dependent receptor [Allopusillimonas ginsengisoli]